MKRLLFLLCLLSLNSFGKIYAEPYLGFSSGSGESQYTSIYNHEYSGRLIGLRAGWLSSNNLFYSLDYSLNNFILDTEQNGSYADDDVSRSQFGLLIGKSFNSFKLWATYFFLADLTGNDSASSGSQFISSSDKIEDGSGLAIGGSIFIWGRTQLCIELRSLSFDSATSSGGNVVTYNSTDLTEYVVSLSFPFGVGR